MGIRIHSRLMFKYREDLVCRSMRSLTFEITEFTYGIMSMEITNHRPQIRKSRFTADIEFTNHG